MGNEELVATAVHGSQPERVKRAPAGYPYNTGRLVILLCLSVALGAEEGAQAQP